LFDEVTKGYPTPRNSARKISKRSTGAAALGPQAPTDAKTLVEAPHISQISSAVNSSPSSEIQPNASMVVAVTAPIRSILPMHESPRTMDQYSSCHSVVTSRGNDADFLRTSMDKSTLRLRSRAWRRDTKSKCRKHSTMLRAGGVR